MSRMFCDQPGHLEKDKTLLISETKFQKKWIKISCLITFCFVLSVYVSILSFASTEGCYKVSRIFCDQPRHLKRTKHYDSQSIPLVLQKSNTASAHSQFSKQKVETTLFKYFILLRSLVSNMCQRILSFASTDMGMNRTRCSRMFCDQPRHLEKLTFDLQSSMCL